MLKKVLIANRGEIAVRIIRACKELNIKTVAVFSTEDRDALHVKLADESICIGSAKSSESYLNINNILTAAVNLKCDGIHPGYGFLSENYKFAEEVEKLNIKFIGPSSKVIKTMGDKIKAKELMEKNNIPIVPGSKGVVSNVNEAKKIAQSIGFPILIKASGGGGGRGMRRVYNIKNIEYEFKEARKEAISAFNNGDMYIEKLIENPKHVEIQILADSFGNIISLGERDCSIQRKNQKMIEESPCPSIDESLREKMSKYAVLAAKACNYENAGTIEFVLDKDKFYFIEMNTRLQVEHPVTEMVSGVDIVKEQLKIASKIPLSIKDNIKINTHSIECRINAENPFKNFMPEAGKVDFLNIPGGKDIRFDTYLYSGSSISPYYDSMIGKLIVCDNTRVGAIKKLRSAIEELVVDGVMTNSLLQYSILFNEEFIKGNYNTSFIEKNLDALLLSLDLDVGD